MGQDKSDDISIMRKINLIFRFSYTLPFFLASLCGALFAFVVCNVPVYVVVLIPLVVLFLAIFVNFSNDYFDHRSGVDKMRFEDKERLMSITDSELLKKVYWEGNPFDNGLVTDKQGKAVMAILIIISILIAIPIIWHGGWPVIVFGAIGIALSYFYTAPPVDFGARGLGELDVAMSFFMLVFCSFFVGSSTFDWTTFALTFEFNWTIFVFSVMIGVAVGLMRLTDSMSGQKAHIARGEKSIAVRLGLEGTVPVAKGFLVLVYLIAAVMVYFNPTYLLLFLTLPFAVKAWKIMSEKADAWEIKIAPLFFGVAFMTELLFIIALAIQTFLNIGSLF